MGCRKGCAGGRRRRGSRLRCRIPAIGRSCRPRTQASPFPTELVEAPVESRVRGRAQHQHRLAVAQRHRHDVRFGERLGRGRPRGEEQLLHGGCAAPRTPALTIA